MGKNVSKRAGARPRASLRLNSKKSDGTGQARETSPLDVENSKSIEEKPEEEEDMSNDENDFGGPKMCLNDLPDDPLRRIVSYLPLDDALQFTQLHSDWLHMKPIVETVTQDDFTDFGPRHGHFNSIR